MTDATQTATVATLWIGGDLGWMEYLCLKSFVAAGQPIVLYHYDTVGNVPEGVVMRDARAIYDVPEDLAEKTAASYVADIFRLHLMVKTDEIWVDTDVICHKPIGPDADGFTVGWSPWHGEINNCILRLPRGSKTLTELTTFLDDMTIIPKWIRPVLRKRLEKIPVEERLVGRYQILRTIIGPKALTYIMKNNGEHVHALEPDFLLPVPWQFVDVIFNPYGGWEGWTSDNTHTMHLWSNALGFHKKKPPHPDSYVGQWAAKLDAPLP